MKKIVFLMDYYYPNPSPNAICAFKIMDYLKKNNKIYCISADKTKFNLHKEEVDGINIYRVKKRLHYTFMEMCNMKITLGKNHYKIIKFLGRIVIWIKNRIYQFVWPIMSYKLIYRFVKQTEELIYNNSIDKVVAISYPFESLIAASIIKRKFPNIECIGYFLDVTTIGNINKKGILREISKYSSIRQERRVIKTLDKLIILDNAKELYLEKYKDFIDKFHISDIPLISKNTGNNKISNKEVNIVYTGSLSRKTRNPITFIDALNSIDKSIKFIFYGNDDRVFEKWSKEEIKNKNVVLKGSVSEREADKAIYNSNCLLSLGNTDKFLIPSKIFKYMNSGKKIIHIAQIETDPCLNYLNKYPNALIVFKQDLVNDSHLVVKKIIEFIYDNSEVSDNLNLEELFFMSTPKYTANIINNM